MLFELVKLFSPPFMGYLGLVICGTGCIIGRQEFGSGSICFHVSYSASFTAVICKDFRAYSLALKNCGRVGWTSLPPESMSEEQGCDLCDFS